jgi:hypothetical protein
MKLEKLMGGKYYETVVRCYDLAGKYFLIGKIKLRSKYRQEKGPELE